MGFPSGSVVKNSPAVRETQVRSLGQEAPMEKEMATHSSVLAWEIPGKRGAWQATAHSGEHDLATNQQQQHQGN